MTMPVTVAHIKNDALLGMDFMEITECVIDSKNRQLKFGELVVQGFAEESRIFCDRVTLQQTVSIPPGHEMVYTTRQDK